MSMINATVVGVLVALGAIVSYIVVMRWRSPSGVSEAPQRANTDAWAEFGAKSRELTHELMVRMDALEADHTSVRAAVALGIENVERVENRIRATIRRASKELEEHGLESPGLQAEAHQLSLVDGDGIEPGEVPPMPEDVEGDWSSIPGVTVEQLRKVRGL